MIPFSIHKMFRIVFLLFVILGLLNSAMAGIVENTLSFNCSLFLLSELFPDWDYRMPMQRETTYEPLPELPTGDFQMTTTNYRWV
jgi:hypothetical protein